jgi:hypothetical protein
MRNLLINPALASRADWRWASLIGALCPLLDPEQMSVRGLELSTAVAQDLPDFAVGAHWYLVGSQASKLSL